MSAISSQLSFPSSGHWNLNPRVFNIMDSIYAIAFGLGLRTLVDAVSQDLKLTGSLIGLWEGVITLHFVKKMPKSSDPYIAYGVRLFIDFLITESMERMVLVLIWTAFGLVLADVTPAIWDEVGLNRVWRHFRRDLYTIYDKIPTVAFFPPQRTVRFLPPREREREQEREQEPGEITPSSQYTPLAVIPPLPYEPSESLKHRVPGYYPGDFSDTDTDFGSIYRSRTSLRTEVNDAIGTPSITDFSTYAPKLNLTYSVSDLDEGNRSSVISSPSLTHDEIPDMEEVLVDVSTEEVLPVPTPKEAVYIAMPPTPSDSARWDIHRDVVDGILHAKPPGQDLPKILDLEEDGGASGTSDDWEKINRRELDEDGLPPTPPAKDRPVGGGDLLVQIPPIVPPVSSPTAENRRESLPPAYSSHHMDDFEDMYYNPPEKATVAAAADDHANVNEHIGNDNNNNNDLSKISFQQAGDDFDINTGTSANPWDVPTLSDGTAQARGNAEIQAEEAAERKRKEEEENRILKEAEEEAKLKEEEAKRREEEAKRLAEEEAKRLAEEELEAKRLEEEKAKRLEEEKAKRLEEEEAKRLAEEELEAKRLEEEKAKQLAEEELEAKRLEEEEAKRLAEEKLEAKRLEEEEAKRLEEEEAKRKEEETKLKEEAKQLEEEEKALKAQQAEELRREKEAEKKKKADEIAERKKKEDDDAALRKQKQIEAAAEQKRKDEEAEKERMEKEAKQKEEEDAERKRQDEAAAHAKEAEAEREQAELDKQNADASGDQVTEEKEDDSKTVHGLDIFGAQHQQSPSDSDNVQDSNTPPHKDFTEEESVISAATTADPPQEAKVRLERMMILRAQMVDVEKRLDELEGRGLDETSPEMKAAEKSLRKFRRHADRRFAAGDQLTRNFEGPSDDISLGALDPQMAGVIIEENLEQLLTPSSRSISFKLTFGTNSRISKVQKPVVLKTLDTYNLRNYTIEKSRKEYRIEISEENFADWLTDYRTSVARRDSENAEEGDDGWKQVY